MPDSSSPEIQVPGVRTPEGTVYDPDARVAVSVADSLAPELEFVEREQRALLQKIHVYLVAGLLISAAVAHFAMGNVDTVQYVREHRVGFQVLFLLEVLAVAAISRAIEQLPIALTSIVFVSYAALNGISFAVFFLFLPPDAVAWGFLVPALTFGVMAAYARQTGADLGSVRSLLVTYVVGFAIVCGINLALQKAMVYWATSYIGVILLASLANYHAQDFRDFDFEFDDDDEENHKAALTGALLLYLDVVNLYMMMSRLAGRARARN